MAEVMIITSIEEYRVIYNNSAYWVKRMWVQKEHANYVIRDVYNDLDLMGEELRNKIILAVENFRNG